MRKLKSLFLSTGMESARETGVGVDAPISTVVMTPNKLDGHLATMATPPQDGAAGEGEW